MKNAIFILCTVLGLGLAGVSHAEKAKAINCGTWPPTNDLKCADKGGTISCIEGSSSPLCCKTGKDGKKVCTNNPDLIDKKANLQGTVSPQAGPGKGAMDGGPKQPGNTTTQKTGTVNKNAPAIK